MSADVPTADLDDTVGIGSGTTVRPQHLIVTVFGRYVRAHGGVIQIADLIEMMAALGVDASAVRSAVSRLKQRGVLVSIRSGGGAAYRVAESLEAVFAAGDHRIFEERRAQPSDPWLLASFSVPERERPLRHQLRKLLQRLGFGQVSGGLWIAPGAIADETRIALARAGLHGYVELFVGSRVSEEDLTQAVRRWWDLPALEPMYGGFLQAFRPALTGERADRDAFAAHVGAITQWRRLAYLDPGIPLALLPERWIGLEAEQLFGALHRRLEPAAERFVASVMN
ncbi:PaaX family transcriptional regulator C-terminal domain-containing protein [Microbacterium luteolum]|uniref:Transcriptional regulator n=1 Tax=Microbacterium luteolum TaxID=69367 RepID=A0ABY7XLN5_MICLT|nr:PaaX family transcriptional regulator C-terminal domain-containing protein [Microbacterium luteolum]WDM43046.1 transcriptional regulator [Microbacterium luteolum]